MAALKIFSLNTNYKSRVRRVTFFWGSWLMRLRENVMVTLKYFYCLGQFFLIPSKSRDTHLPSFLGGFHGVSVILSV